MKNGDLNQEELRLCAGIHRKLNALQSKIPQTGRSERENNTLHLLLEARNRLGELLRWQDHNGVWQTCIPTPLPKL